MKSEKKYKSRKHLKSNYVAPDPEKKYREDLASYNERFSGDDY